MAIIVVCLVFILAFWKFNSVSYPHSPINSKGYGFHDEDTETLLSKIEWANNYTGRAEFNFRFLWMSIVLGIFSFSILGLRLNSFFPFFQLVFVYWILLRSFNLYCRHHGDKFSNYAISRNVSLIRKKLNLKKNKNLKGVGKRFPTDSDCRNFTFKGKL